MKRKIEIIIDLKVQEYSNIKLKQFDDTQILFKVVDDGISFSLEGLQASLVFEKPDHTIVYQECEIEEDKIKADLLKSCLRQNGNAQIELQLSNTTEMVSTFQILVVIAKSAKENIESDNTPNYIEILEDAIVEEQIRRQNEELRKSNELERQQNEEERIDNEETREDNEDDRIEAETQRNSNEETRQANETTRGDNEDDRIAAEELRDQAESARAQSYSEMKNYFDNNAIATHKFRLMINEDYEAGENITIPCYYKVGVGVLDVFLNGEKLLLSSDAQGTDGHYLEVGEANSISNVIKTTTDWNCEIGDYFDFVVRGEYSVQTE